LKAQVGVLAIEPNNGLVCPSMRGAGHEQHYTVWGSVCDYLQVDRKWEFAVSNSPCRIRRGELLHGTRQSMLCGFGEVRNGK
jgi:hypothetical protein